MAQACNFIKKETLAQVFFAEHIRAIASDSYNLVQSIITINIHVSFLLLLQLKIHLVNQKKLLRL